METAFNLVLDSGQFIRLDVSEVLEMEYLFSEYRLVVWDLDTHKLSHVTMSVADSVLPSGTIHVPAYVGENIELTVYALSMYYTNSSVILDVLASGRTYMTHDGRKKKFILKLRHHEKSRSILKDTKRSLSSYEDLVPITIRHQPPSWHTIFNDSYDVNENHDAFLVLRDNDSFQETYITEKQSDMVQVPFQLSSVRSYSVQLFLLSSAHLDDVFHIYHLVAASEIIPFVSYMTLDDLQLLKVKAERFLVKDGNRMAPISHFYRNKPKWYYNQIRRKGGIMKTYRKVPNGDIASSINGNITGLYFSAYLEKRTLEPPTFSFFGSVRLNLPANVMLGLGRRLYFADFYCHYKKHHVTLVLTKKGSWTDMECERRLLELDIWNNPFLHLRLALNPPEYDRLLSAFTSLSVLVEVLYTEDINIRELFSRYPSHAFFSTVATRGGGISNLRGKPKNSNCKVCSVLEPFEPLPTPQQENIAEDLCPYQNLERQ